ncbi:MAG TPA: ATP-binding protein [Euryarchaeota archaeon]|nr:ATP-binding protein [Euryarchaeota archaeon]
MPRRTLVTMMNALSSGVVPRRGLEYIAVGRRKETETFVNDLEDTAEGGGAFRFISGKFGNGKSFMIQMIRNYAMDRGFVVMDADLAINRRLTGSKKEGLNTYRELVRNMAVKSRPDGGAMELILQRWIDSVRERMAAERGVAMNDLPQSDVAERLRRETSEMSGMTFYQDFAAVVSAYWTDISSGRDDMPSLRWLKGEYDLKSDVRRDLGLTNMVNDANWYDFIKIWAEFCSRIGYRGLVVFIDEGVILYKIQNRVSRSNNYERLLSMFNDIMQGKASHLSMYVCGTPEFIEDPDRGLYSYEALRSRLVSGKFENGYDNYLGPVINLRPLTNEEIFVLLRTLRGMHEQRYGYSSELDDSMLETYLKTVTCAIGQGLVTPREITRDFISLLDTMHQNPDVTFSELVEGRTVTPDRDPDDDLIEDLEV